MICSLRTLYHYFTTVNLGESIAVPLPGLLLSSAAEDWYPQPGRLTARFIVNLFRKKPLFYRGPVTYTESQPSWEVQWRVTAPWLNCGICCGHGAGEGPICRDTPCVFKRRAGAHFQIIIITQITICFHQLIFIFIFLRQHQFRCFFIEWFCKSL